MTLSDIPRHYGRTRPDKIAVVDAAGSKTFAALDADSNRVANVLIGLGVEPGARVALLAKNCSRYFDVLFGVCKAGASLVPLNWKLTQAEMAAVVEDASPAVIIADCEYAELAEAVRGHSRNGCPMLVFDTSGSEASTLDVLMRASSDTDPAIETRQESTALLMYTSGTTGKSKGVQLSHRGFYFARLSDHLEPSLRFEDDDLVLTVVPLFHAMANYFSLQALYNGATVAAYPMPDAGELIQMIGRHRPTIVPLVPTALWMVLDHPSAAQADFSSLRRMVYGGASMDANLLKRAMHALKCDFMQFYGATETGGSAVMCLRPGEHHADNIDRLKSCGTPLPLVEVRVVDERGNELPDGQVGEFMIRAPFLTSGYFNQPEATRATFKDGWYGSGDAGYRDSDGFHYVVDRIKDVIITGGENVYSTEVEQALCLLKGVQSCAVIGLPDEKWGEKVVAAIIADPAAALSSDAVLTHCRSLIANYKVPKQVTFVNAMPMTATGKVKKAALRTELLSNRS